jgi:hypothetical protein
MVFVKSVDKIALRNGHPVKNVDSGDPARRLAPIIQSTVETPPEIGVGQCVSIK